MMMRLHHDHEAAFVAPLGEEHIIFSTPEAVESWPAKEEEEDARFSPTKGGKCSASSSPTCSTAATASPTASDSASISLQVSTPGSSATSSPGASLSPIEPSSPTGPPEQKSSGVPAQQGKAVVERSGFGISEAEAEKFEAPTRHNMLSLAGLMLMLSSISLETGMPTSNHPTFAKVEDARAATKLVSKAVHLLLACGYPWEDVELIGAQASSYMERLLKGLRETGRPEMELMERAHVLCLLMYLSHTYVEDEHCPAKYWHQRLFVSYCNMRTMNAAVLSLLQNLGYKLRVEQTELEHRLALLREPRV